MIDRAFVLGPMQVVASKFLMTMKEFPPSQTPGDWSLDSLEKQIKSMTARREVAKCASAHRRSRPSPSGRLIAVGRRRAYRDKSPGGCRLPVCGRSLRKCFTVSRPQPVSVPKRRHFRVEVSTHTLQRWAVCVLASLTSAAASAADPLPSWNDGAAKQAIIAFVERGDQGRLAGFRARAERIAIFDNDGTLWCEQPMYVQLVVRHRPRQGARAAASGMEDDRSRSPSVLKGDMKASLAGGREGRWSSCMAATHAGMTTDEFEQIVEDWLATAKHPKTGRPYTEMVYQPMLELLAYLRANGFKTYIVSGGGIEFMRPWAERVYGIPPEQVVGSSVKTKFELRDGRPVLVACRSSIFIDDKEGKPVGIQQFIGRRPIARSATPTATCRCCNGPRSTARGPRFGLIVHHTDAEREYAYDARAPQSAASWSRHLTKPRSADGPWLICSTTGELCFRRSTERQTNAGRRTRAVSRRATGFIPIRSVSWLR